MTITREAAEQLKHDIFFELEDAIKDGDVVTERELSQDYFDLSDAIMKRSSSAKQVLITTQSLEARAVRAGLASDPSS